MDIIKEKISNARSGSMLAIDVPADHIMRANVGIIQELQSLGYEGVYIALSKNYNELSQVFDYMGIDKTKLYVVDAISNVYGSVMVDLPTVKYIHSPSAIRLIDQAVNDLLAGMHGEKKFVLLDSVTILLLYNSFEQTMDLCTMLSKTVKNNQSVGIIMSLFLGVPNKKMSDGLLAIVDESVGFHNERS